MSEELKPCLRECFWVRDRHPIYGVILRCLICEKRSSFIEAPKRPQ